MASTTAANEGPLIPHSREATYGLFLEGLVVCVRHPRVLVVGSGEGELLGVLSNAEDLSLSVADFAEARLQRAGKQLASTASRLTLLKPHTALPFAGAAFDVVVTVDLAIEATQQFELLRELHRVSARFIVHLGPTQEGEPGSGVEVLLRVYRELGLGLPRRVEPGGGFVALVLDKAPAEAIEASAADLLRKDLDASRKTIGQQAATAAALSTRNAMLEARIREYEALPGTKILRAARHSAPVKLAGRLRRSAPMRDALASLQKLPFAGALEGIDALGFQFAGIATRASLESATEFVAARPEVVVLCHPEWRGIRAATYGQSEYVLEIPGIESPGHAERIGAFLEACSTRTLVINGYPPKTEVLAQTLRRRFPQIDVHFVYHGTPAQFHFGEGDIIGKMLSLADEGAVKKLGFVKKGLAEYFRGIGYSAEYVMNVLKEPFSPARAGPAADGHLHVGVFGSHVCHKNVETQLMATLMVPGTVAHLADHPVAPYLRRHQHRIVEHGLMPREPFLELLRTMHATTYASLVECYPMTVLESLAAGAPVVTSHTSGIFDSRPDLFATYVVTAHDEPLAIARRLSWLLEHRVELIPEAQAFVTEMNERAEQRWAEFVAR